MSNWREDKKFVENFMKKNHETSTNYFHVMNKTNKNTWNEIANDLRRQIDAVKKMKQNIDEFEAEQAAETRRRAEEITEENRRQNIRQQKQEQRAEPIEFIHSNIFSEPKIKSHPLNLNAFNLFDTEPKIKSEPVEFNEFKNIFYNSKFTEDNIKVINNADIENDGLEVFFNGHESKFSDVKESILNKLNSTNLDALYIQVFFKTYDGKIHFQTYSLNNEQGRTIIYNLLRGEEYLDNDYYVDNSDSLVSVSDSNNTEGIEAKITPRMLTGFRITNKANENKKIINKVYCDNGGSFYIYKINEKYLSNVELIKKLERYQIFNDLKNKAFDVNCLVYSMIQTNLFSEAVINSMKATCYTRYISQKQLNEFGEKYEIAFNVIKFRDDKNDWADISHGKNLLEVKNQIT